MVNYTKITQSIIKGQELVIGPLAWVEAAKVSGLTVKDHAVSVQEDGKKAVEALVRQYEKLFGRASVEVCKSAVSKIVVDMDKNAVPGILL